MPDVQERCQRCGEPIRKTNWALGPGWNHENGDSRCYMGHALGPAYWEPAVTGGSTPNPAEATDGSAPSRNSGEPS